MGLGYTKRQDIRRVLSGRGHKEIAAEYRAIERSVILCVYPETDGVFVAPRTAPTRRWCQTTLLPPRTTREPLFNRCGACSPTASSLKTLPSEAGVRKSSRSCERCKKICFPCHVSLLLRRVVAVMYGQDSHCALPAPIMAPSELSLEMGCSCV